MKIIRTYLPNYTVTFDHPDDGSRTYDFIVNLEEDKVPWTEEDLEEFHKDLMKAVWNQFNSSCYWHTMTIVATYIIDDKIYKTTICEEAGQYDILN